MKYINFEEDYWKGRFSNYKDYKKTWRQNALYFKIIIHFVRKYKLQSIPSFSKRILDIGCAFGFLLSFFDKEGWETYGIDISKYAIENAKHYTRAKLYIHDIERGFPMFKDDYFDLITMFDVIEHLKSPYCVLKEVYRILKPKGLCIITTPNIHSIGKSLLGKKWAGFKDKTHIYLFCKDTLKFLLEKVGFKIYFISEAQFYPLPPTLWRISIRIPKGGSLIAVCTKIK